MRLWPGSCYAHILFTKESIERCRIEYPGAPVVAHPECVDTVRDLADEVCSTEKMVGFCRDNPADTFIILTETGMMHRLTRELPDKSFVAGPTGGHDRGRVALRRHARSRQVRHPYHARRAGQGSSTAEDLDGRCPRGERDSAAATDGLLDPFRELLDPSRRQTT